MSGADDTIQRDLAAVYRIGNLINAESDPDILYERVLDAIFEVGDTATAGLAKPAKVSTGVRVPTPASAKRLAIIKA